MPRDQLKQQLQQLHDTLAQQPQLDDDSQQLLRKVAADIDAQLQQGMEPEQVADLSDQVQQQVVQLEHQHPTLATILRQVMDTLARIGV